ncbi:hypothetical protein BGZ76_001261 [Entomortierella beljakovae]|nr:hypothetical protein BGZ76_001261 [Entomortierella beljakovae]
MDQVENKKPEEIEELLKLHDSFKPVWLTETIQLGPLLPSDKDSCIEYLNDPRIHQWLNGPPNPYTPEAADHWINTRYQRLTKEGIPLSFTIRDMERGGKAIGSVSVSDESDDKLDQDDTGYWIAPEYQGRGLMAKALGMMLWKISVEQVGKRKFNAFTFAGNWASRRTLEKVGFVYQPDIQKSVTKFGVAIPTWVYRLYITEETIANHKKIEEATPLPQYA